MALRTSGAFCKGWVCKWEHPQVSSTSSPAATQVPGFDESQQSQANTALTNAQVENVPIQGQVMQAQIPSIQANTRAQQIANQQAQQSIIDQQLYRQALANVRAAAIPNQGRLRLQLPRRHLCSSRYQ